MIRAAPEERGVHDETRSRKAVAADDRVHTRESGSWGVMVALLGKGRHSLRRRVPFASSMPALRRFVQDAFESATEVAGS